MERLEPIDRTRDDAADGAQGRRLAREPRRIPDRLVGDQTGRDQLAQGRALRLVLRGGGLDRVFKPHIDKHASLQVRGHRPGKLHPIG